MFISGVREQWSGIRFHCADWIASAKNGLNGNAGPSTSLRFAQDDKSVAGRAGIGESENKKQSSAAWTNCG
jgi:hypothetical protein